MDTPEIPLLGPLAGLFFKKLQTVHRNPSDEAGIHDARVAGRRLQAAGDLWIPTQPAWKRLRRRLKRVVRDLGRLRDFDVSLGLLRRGAAADRPERRTLSAALRKLRIEERARLAGRFWDRGLVRRFRRLLPPLLPPPGPAALTSRYERILALLVTARTSEEAHRVRREIRRLRYAHETLRAAYTPANFNRAGRLLRRIQRAAGAWQDLCVLKALLDKSGLAPKLPRLRRHLRTESTGRARIFLKSVVPLAALRECFLKGG